MKWDWNAVSEFMPYFWDGLLVTLQILVFGSLISFVLGLVWALLMRVPSRWVTWPVGAVTEFVRNTPLLVQLFFLFYVLPELGLTLSGLFVGIVTLGVHYACYYAEVYRAGIDAVPRGQWEGCTALSLPTRYQWQHVVLPQAIRNVLPSLGNYVISMFKETPFLFLIAVPEMVQEAVSVGGRDFRYLEPVTIAGLIFLAASYPSAVAMRKLERRLGHA
jgi:polar amino acid transport system permease protein